MTNWLLVDYGETISGPFATDAVTQLATLAGQAPHEFLQRYWRHGPGYDVGQPSQSYWSRVLRRDPTDIEPIIEPLAATIDNIPWSREFTYRIYSCRIREVKPDRAAFTTALEILDAEPHRVLFIDDRPDNTRAATLLGIRASTFTSANDLANEFSTIRGETATHPTRPGAEPTLDSTDSFYCDARCRRACSGGRAAVWNPAFRTRQTLSYQLGSAITLGVGRTAHGCGAPSQQGSM
jgi:hypothetical protein